MWWSARGGTGAPFLAKPYVALRGVPALRYQDTRAAVVEKEPLERHAALGTAWLQGRWLRPWRAREPFGRGQRGGTWHRFSPPDCAPTRLYAGLDVAWGTEQRAVYVQVGGAWF